MHYINIEDIDKEGDSSGVYVYYTKEKQDRLAGVLSMHVDTNVPSFARSFQDVACKISENKVCTYYYFKHKSLLIVFITLHEKIFSFSKYSIYSGSQLRSEAYINIKQITIYWKDF